VNVRCVYLALLFAVVMGCDRSAPKEQGPAGAGGSEVSAEEVKRKAGEALTAAGRYASQERDEYVRRARVRLDELEKQAEELRKRAGEMKETASAELREKLDRLEAQRKELRKDLETLESASADAWTDVQARFESALTHLEQSFQRAVSRFEKQPEHQTGEDPDTSRP
jgi:predicted nuclease with TOPRIM domain